MFVGIFSYLHETLEDYLRIYGDISVTMGTIYDYDNDGLWEGVTNSTRYRN